MVGFLRRQRIALYEYIGNQGEGPLWAATATLFTATAKWERSRGAGANQGSAANTSVARKRTITIDNVPAHVVVKRDDKLVIDGVDVIVQSVMTQPGPVIPHQCVVGTAGP